MLETLLLKNFQAHRRLEVRFSPTVTTIVGPSDVGKTAILRALRWVLLNEGLGGIQRHGTNKTSVKVRLDGRNLLRRKVGSTNTYVLDGKQYAAIRRDVPDAVRTTTKVRSLNFQGQHDAPFWLADSGGSVSRELNEVVDLSIIDRTLKAASIRLRDASTIRKHAEGRLQDAAATVRSLAWVEKAQAHYQALEAAEKGLAKVRSRAANLAGLVAKLQAASQALARGKDRAVAGRKLLAMATAARKATKRRQGLENVLGQATAAATLADLQVPKVHRLGFAIQHREELEALITKLRQETNRWHDLQKLQASTSKRLGKLLKGSSRCPVCGKRLSRS